VRVKELRVSPPVIARSQRRQRAGRDEAISSGSSSPVIARPPGLVESRAEAISQTSNVDTTFIVYCLPFVRLLRRAAHSAMPLLAMTEDGDPGVMTATEDLNAITGLVHTQSSNIHS